MGCLLAPNLYEAGLMGHKILLAQSLQNSIGRISFLYCSKACHDSLHDLVGCCLQHDTDGMLM